MGTLRHNLIVAQSSKSQIKATSGRAAVEELPTQWDGTHGPNGVLIQGLLIVNSIFSYPSWGGVGGPRSNGTVHRGKQPHCFPLSYRVIIIRGQGAMLQMKWNLPCLRCGLLRGGGLWWSRQMEPPTVVIMLIGASGLKYSF